MDQHDYSVGGSDSSQRIDESVSEAGAAAPIAMRHLSADPATVRRGLGVSFVPASEQRLLPSLGIGSSRLGSSPNPWDLWVGTSAPLGAENLIYSGTTMPSPAARPHLNLFRGGEERSSVHRDFPANASDLSLHAALPQSLAASTAAVGVGSPLQLAPRATSRGAPPPLVLTCGQDEQQGLSAGGARSSSREQALEASLIGFPSALIHAMNVGVAPGRSDSSAAAAGAALGSRGGEQGTATVRASAASVQWGSGLALSQPALPAAREIRFALLGERESAGEGDRAAAGRSGAAVEARGGGVGGEEGGQKEGLKGLFGLGQAEAPGAQALVGHQRRHDDPCGSGAAAPLHSTYPQPAAPSAAASAAAAAAAAGGAGGAAELRCTLGGSVGGSEPQEGSKCLGGAFLSLGFPGTSAVSSSSTDGLPRMLTAMGGGRDNAWQANHMHQGAASQHFHVLPRQEPVLRGAEQQGKRVEEVGTKGLSELLLRARGSREASPIHARSRVEVGASAARGEGLRAGPREDVWLGLGAGLALQGAVGGKGGAGEGRLVAGGAVDSSAVISIGGAVGAGSGEFSPAALASGAVGSTHGEGGEVAQERGEEGRGAGGGRAGGGSGRIWSGGEREGSVDSCEVELTSHKDYYRRHRVCEAHAKATHVHIQGKAQRFCQQCSRFHDLCEFDDSRRSCRRRLLGHNRRRRKQQHQPLLQGTSPPQQPLAQPPPLQPQQQQQQQQRAALLTHSFQELGTWLKGRTWQWG
ncbi:unnamed protein product [Closterium sp. Yama58-4]|nr:unnamed protein product [Closterium sp. Yama58-4]